MSATYQATVKLIDGMSFAGQTSGGHTVTMDAAPEVGGQKRGPRPMELQLTALGGCTGMDVISILRKMRQPVVGYEVRVTGERAEEHPKVYTEIVVEHIVYGQGIAPDAVKRAVELSSTRYCPISAMLGKAAHVVHRFQIVEETRVEQSGD